MLTSKQVLDIAADPAKGSGGGLVHALRRANSNAVGTSTLSRSQGDLLDQLLGIAGPTRRETYQHPLVTAARAQPRQEPLTPIELAWLQRLPADPAKVPYADAEQLFTLLHSVQDQSSQRLLHSIAAPIKHLHDRGAAHVALSNASQPLIAPPPVIEAALTDAIRAEHTTLQPAEASQRARALLQEVADHRVQQRDHQIWQAQETINGVDRAAADRAAVTR